MCRTSGRWTATPTTRPSGGTACISSPNGSSVDHSHNLAITSDDNYTHTSWRCLVPPPLAGGRGSVRTCRDPEDRRRCPVIAGAAAHLPPISMKSHLPTVLVFILAAGVLGAGERLRLQYAHPAERWTEALPVGNGRLGAMVFGGVASE